METVKKLEKCSVLRLPFKEIDGAFIILSFKYETISAAHLDFYYKWKEPAYRKIPYMSFFYASNDTAAEWEPKHGPIMTYEKCEKDWKGINWCDKEISAKEHWFFDYVKDEPLAFSQLAVDEERLHEKLTNNDYAGIFSVLKRWAERE